MSTQKKKPINDARKEVSDALENFIKLEAEFNNNYPHKPLNCKVGNFSFFASDVETNITEWENIYMTFTTDNGLKISIELNKFNAMTLYDFLIMDINELDNRDNSSEEDESEDEETEN